MAGVISMWWPVRWRFIRGGSSQVDGASRPRWSNRLAEIGGLDVHSLPVLGYGPARHLDALLGEDVGYAMVGERLSCGFRGDELLDQSTNGGWRTGPPRRRLNLAAQRKLATAHVTR